jgi:hypothetical protein
VQVLAEVLPVCHRFCRAWRDKTGSRRPLAASAFNSFTEIALNYSLLYFVYNSNSFIFAMYKEKYINMVL